MSSDVVRAAPSSSSAPLNTPTGKQQSPQTPGAPNDRQPMASSAPSEEAQRPPTPINKSPSSTFNLTRPIADLAALASSTNRPSTPSNATSPPASTAPSTPTPTKLAQPSSPSQAPAAASNPTTTAKQTATTPSSGAFTPTTASTATAKIVPASSSSTTIKPSPSSVTSSTVTSTGTGNVGGNQSVRTSPSQPESKPAAKHTATPTQSTANNQPSGSASATSSKVTAATSTQANSTTQPATIAHTSKTSTPPPATAKQTQQPTTVATPTPSKSPTVSSAVKTPQASSSPSSHVTSTSPPSRFTTPIASFSGSPAAGKPSSASVTEKAAPSNKPVDSAPKRTSAPSAPAPSSSKPPSAESARQSSPSAATTPAPLSQATVPHSDARTAEKHVTAPVASASTPSPSTTPAPPNNHLQSRGASNVAAAQSAGVKIDVGAKARVGVDETRLGTTAQSASSDNRSTPTTHNATAAKKTAFALSDIDDVYEPEQESYEDDVRSTPSNAEEEEEVEEIDTEMLGRASMLSDLIADSMQLAHFAARMSGNVSQETFMPVGFEPAHRAAVPSHGQYTTASRFADSRPVGATGGGGGRGQPLPPDNRAGSTNSTTRATNTFSDHNAFTSSNREQPKDNRDTRQPAVNPNSATHGANPRGGDHPRPMPSRATAAAPVTPSSRSPSSQFASSLASQLKAQVQKQHELSAMLSDMKSSENEGLFTNEEIELVHELWASEQERLRTACTQFRELQQIEALIHRRAKFRLAHRGVLGQYPHVAAALEEFDATLNANINI